VDGPDVVAVSVGVGLSLNLDGGTNVEDAPPSIPTEITETTTEMEETTTPVPGPDFIP